MSKPNWTNQTIWTGDNLPIMRGMNSESVDLIYMDPPFNSKKNYAAPIGSKAAGAEFKDTWSLSDVDVEWINLIEEKQPKLRRVLLAAQSDSDKSYLTYIAARLLEMHRILSSTGSIYLHCDPTMSHYLKAVMDALFGKKRFRNEVIWHYKSFHGNVKRYFPKKHDALLVYNKSGRWTFNRLFREDNTGTVDYERWNKYLVDGRFILGKNMPIQDTRFLRFLNRWVRENGKQPGPDDVVYEVAGQAFDTVWDIKPVDPKNKKEKTGLLTQKPVALLERIVKASSNPDNMVLDPFCGCATACIVAQFLNRQWVGIDISPKAADLVQQRMRDELGLFYRGVHRTDIPKRTDIGKLPKHNSPANRQKLYGIQAGNCAGCGHHFETRHLEVDHIISRGKGGTRHLSNLQLLCGNCNRVKGDRGMDYLKAKLQIGV